MAQSHQVVDWSQRRQRGVPVPFCHTETLFIALINVLRGNHDRQLPLFTHMLQWRCKKPERKSHMSFFTPPCPARFGPKCVLWSFSSVRCRSVKHHIKASLMFYLSRFFSVSVSKLVQVAFYSRFNGSMSIITLALAQRITNFTVAASKSWPLTVIRHSISASTQDPWTFWHFVEKGNCQGRDELWRKYIPPESWSPDEDAHCECIELFI